MAWAGRKSNPKIEKNQPSPPKFFFSATSSLFFLLCRGFRPPPVSLLAWPPSSLPQATSDYLMWWLHQLSLSLSPLQLLLPPLPAAKTGHHLCHSLSHHRTSSSTARPPPHQVAFFSSLSSSSSLPLFTEWTVREL